ncbi:MAG: hypothetical protein Q9198_004688 [Flavoplaca austrocitrina]
METTRIRGGTPTAYVVQHRIEDPELLAQLDELNQRSEQWMAQHIQEAIDQARAEYQYHPPPEMLDSDTELESQLPSPASTPLPSPPNLTHPIQPQNTALTQMANLPSTLPVTHARCTGSEGGIQLPAIPTPQVLPPTGLPTRTRSAALQPQKSRPPHSSEFSQLNHDTIQKETGTATRWVKSARKSNSARPRSR